MPASCLMVYCSVHPRHIKTSEKKLSRIRDCLLYTSEKEENKLLLLRGERVYEESIGPDRLALEYLLRRFEDALDSHDDGKIQETRKELQEKLTELEVF